ncbi:MAG TPA: ABC transporter ATP-binding protein [Terriglobia bacterium]|nr:ABC transporter ATP-binding protein [Terriglobia bacterium]
MSEPVIQIENLTKTYRTGLRRSQVFAVRNLSVTVNRGSIVAFVGPNGAGKTTTIHSLLGFLKPDGGTIKLFGQATGSASLRRRVGYQCEIFHTYPFYTGTQALRYYGQLSGISKAELERAIPLQLERMGLTAAANRKASGFSKGMTQRLGLAQALLHEPELLILDEPTSGLDPEGRRLVLDIIREEKAKGRTVFLSSHILADVERTCDEVVMVRQGEVAFADHLSAFSIDRDEWEVEVVGFNDAIREALGSKCNVAGLNGENAFLVCSSEDKREFLRTLLSFPVEIGTIQRRRTGSLEEAYMKHVGKA